MSKEEVETLTKSAKGRVISKTQAEAPKTQEAAPAGGTSSPSAAEGEFLTGDMIDSLLKDETGG